MAARQCDHLWVDGQEPQRSEVKKHLSTIMNTEPTDSFLRRVRESSKEIHEEVCVSCLGQ